MQGIGFFIKSVFLNDLNNILNRKEKCVTTIVFITNAIGADGLFLLNLSRHAFKYSKKIYVYYLPVVNLGNVCYCGCMYYWVCKKERKIDSIGRAAFACAIFDCSPDREKKDGKQQNHLTKRWHFIYSKQRWGGECIRICPKALQNGELCSRRYHFGKFWYTRPCRRGEFIWWTGFLLSSSSSAFSKKLFLNAFNSILSAYVDLFCISSVLMRPHL